MACVAGVPTQGETKFGSHEGVKFFAFRLHEKWGESKKMEGRGWGRGKKGTFACKPLDFEKHALAFIVEFIYNLVTKPKSQ